MGHKLVSCTWSPILMHDSLRETFSLYVSLYSILEPLWDPKRNFTSTFGLLSRYKSQRKMGQAKGCWILQRVVPSDKSANSYSVSLLLSPVVSVWDCIVRKMRYTYVPEWV
ncbi:unnamed protein product [Brassica oleracea]